MFDLRPALNLIRDRVSALPLLVLYLTEGCNSKCITCDIWQQPRRNMPLPMAEQLASEFPELGVRAVLLSGGEAMQHPDWPSIAAMFTDAGVRVLLLTNGLLLKKQAPQVIKHISEVTVSLDAATSDLYQYIRGANAFDVVLDGIRAISKAGVSVTTRTTVQRTNYHQMPAIVRLGREIGVKRVSFLAVDVKSKQAFGPRDLSNVTFAPYEKDAPNGHGPPTVALEKSDLPHFEATINTMETEFAAEFASGFIAESPDKLGRMRDYFGALAGEAGKGFVRPRCNAPHISAVVEVDGRIRPCYFLPVSAQISPGQSLHESLNARELVAMRHAYRNGQRDECAGCVCPLYRGPLALLKDGFANQ